MASIKKRADGKWRARYRDPDGKEHARHFARKVDAERWLDSVRGQLVSGVWVDPADGKVTFEQYAEQWRTAQPHRPATAMVYARMLRLHAYPRLGGRALSSVRRSDVQAWVASLDGVIAPATIRFVYNRVRTIFKAAVEDRLLHESPCRRVALPELPQERIVPLTVAQVRAAAEAADPRTGALIVAAAGTGLRSGELLGLPVDAIDFLRRTIEVRQQLVYVTGSKPFVGPPKTRASTRTVPAPSFVLEALAEQLRRFPPGEQGLVFASDSGGPMLRTTLHARWKRALRAAGLDEGTHLHHLRHHYASLLIFGGENVKVVQERLGHASAAETLGTYAHLWPSSDERTRSVVESAWATVPADQVRTSGDLRAADQGE